MRVSAWKSSGLAITVLISSACARSGGGTEGQVDEINDNLPKIGVSAVVGEVVDRAGRPAPGLRVRALSPFPRVSLTGTSDSVGRFEFAINRFGDRAQVVLPESVLVEIVAESAGVVRAQKRTMLAFDSLSRPLQRTSVRLVQP
jgi:hypothetical protein